LARTLIRSVSRKSIRNRLLVYRPSDPVRAVSLSTVDRGR